MFLNVVYGQDYYMKIPDAYNDKKAIEIVDSFQLKGTLITYLVYQKSIGEKAVSQLFCKTNNWFLFFRLMKMT